MLADHERMSAGAAHLILAGCVLLMVCVALYTWWEWHHGK